MSSDMITTGLPTLAARLERRYPGVSCKVERTEVTAGAVCPGHALWAIIFLSKDRELASSHALTAMTLYLVTGNHTENEQ